MTGKSTSENLQRIIQPESKKMKLKVSNTKQAKEVSTVTSHKGVNKLELYQQALQQKEHKEKLAVTSKTVRSTPMKSTEDSIGVSDASLSVQRSESSPRVLGLKMGCTFSKGVAPRWSHGLVCRQKDDVENIEVNKTSQPERRKIALLELEKVDDRIDCELSED